MHCVQELAVSYLIVNSPDHLLHPLRPSPP